MENIKQKALETVRYGKLHGVAMKNTTNQEFDGRMMEFDTGKYVNFALCDYLGLSTDVRLRKAAAEASMKYGVYTAVSRSFVKLGIYKEAEDIITSIFNQPCLVVPRTTLGHIAALPAIIDKDDLIILDQQVHTSVQLGAQIAVAQGSKMEILRHSRMDLLEERLKELSATYSKIWYLADGIYSMFGDTIPVAEVMDLLDRYPKFHLYVDDAHGMSWMGENGKGFFLTKTKFHPKLVLLSSLGKGFGSGGGVIICPDEKMKEQIEILGAPLMFTSPVAPPTLGAIIESAKIHLSDEIKERQAQLKKRIVYVRKKAFELGLPIVGSQPTPITFIATGKPDMTSDVGVYLMKRGFYLTGGEYPAVPFNNSGARIVTTLHQNFDDIDKMLEALKYACDSVLKDRGMKLEDVLKFYKHFDFFNGTTKEL